MLYRNACIESFLYAPVLNGARIWFVSSHYHWLLARHLPNYFFGEVEEQQWKGKGRRENFQRRFTARSINGKGNWLAMRTRKFGYDVSIRTSFLPYKLMGRGSCVSMLPTISGVLN